MYVCFICGGYRIIHISRIHIGINCSLTLLQAHSKTAMRLGKQFNMLLTEDGKIKMLRLYIEMALDGSGLV